MRRIGCILLCLGLLLGLVSCGPEQTAEQRAVAGQLKLLGGDFSDPEATPAGSPVPDWTAFSFALLGKPCDGYLDRLEQWVTERYQTEEKLDEHRVTTWHRVALTVLALGGDPTAFGTLPDGSPVNLIADGVYNCERGRLEDQGINALAYALLTLDAGGYDVPEGSNYTRQGLLEAIVSRQNADGGFGLTAGRSDVDVTAIVLQALAPYEETESVKEAGLSYMAQQQTEAGIVNYYGDITCESAAQVVIALCALGVDPRQFGEGTSVAQELLAFQLADGSFCHVAGGGGDRVATVQALEAFAAMKRYDEGLGSLYDLSEG